jgi:hypothetical protein
MDVSVPSPDVALQIGVHRGYPFPESHPGHPHSLTLPPTSVAMASMPVLTQTLSPIHKASPHKCAPGPMVLDDDAIRDRMAALQLQWKNVLQSELYGSLTTEDHFDAVFTLLEDMCVTSVMLHVPGKTFDFTRSQHGLHQLVVTTSVSAVWEDESEDREAASLDARVWQQAHWDPKTMYDNTTECDAECGSDKHEAGASDIAMDFDVLHVHTAHVAAGQVDAVGCSVDLRAAALDAQGRQQALVEPKAIYDDTTECDTECDSDKLESATSDIRMDCDVPGIDKTQVATAHVGPEDGCKVSCLQLLWLQLQSHFHLRVL